MSKTPQEHLRHVVDHAGHLLPAQGPIGVFIHHNTLHAFQHLPFENAVEQAAGIFGTEPYMPEDLFRRYLKQGRIEEEDIDFVLDWEPNKGIIPDKLDRKALRRALLVSGARQMDESTIRWELEDGELRRTFDADPQAETLYKTCYELIGEIPPQKPESPIRPRDGFLSSLGIDLDETVHPVLIRMCAAYLDQGLAYWPMPFRERGFLLSVRQLWLTPNAVDPEKLEGLTDEFQAQNKSKLNAEDVVWEMLNRLGVNEEEWEQFLLAELLALPGWAGMIRRLEKEPHLVQHNRVPFSLMEFLAVRLTLTTVAANAANTTGLTLPNAWQKGAAPSNDPRSIRYLKAARIFDAAHKTKLTAVQLENLTPQEFELFRQEVESIDSPERRRLFQLAYEYWHERKILGPISNHRQKYPPRNIHPRPSAQVMFCLDEREESIRRHLEEIDPQIQTHGTAGFYGIAVNYTGIDDGSGAALCPIVVTPRHAVRELPVQDDHGLHRMRKLRRKLMARVTRGMFVSSRTLFRGWLSTVWLGVWSLFPLTVRILAPRRYGQLRESLNRAFLPEPRTELTLMRNDHEGHDVAEGLLLGFSIAEKVERVASVLVPAGMKQGFARIVIALGHGSTSLNNPHESAYDCGACGGRKGGPNGRLFAAMANHPEVRKGLRDRGVYIPDDTWFVGGYHDTCNDDIDLFDLDLVPESHLGDLARIQKTFAAARAANAHERSRRFESANPQASLDDALLHVEERSEHIAEPRPECGHGTNAVTYFGRRATVRGLFLDRRAFLICYDAAQDPEDHSLTALLAAGGPVCAGINLEYYFSFVDNEGYGCGTKLPHNVTSLVGVMNGHSSDLRTGLPSQMIEIHEPVRSLFIVETTPERFQNAMSRLPGVIELVQNQWIRLATLDPDTGTVHVYRDGVFEPMTEVSSDIPSVPSSLNWYQGKIDHLPVALIEKGLVSAS